jgi:hypothetical protein
VIVPFNDTSAGPDTFLEKQLMEGAKRGIRVTLTLVAQHDVLSRRDCGCQSHAARHKRRNKTCEALDEVTGGIGAVNRDEGMTVHKNSFFQSAVPKLKNSCRAEYALSVNVPESYAIRKTADWTGYSEKLFAPPVMRLGWWRQR